MTGVQTCALPISSSSSDRQKFTISAWIKKSQFGSYQGFVQATCPNPPFADSFDGLRWNSSDQLEFCARGGNDIYLVPNMLFRDPSAWYHIVVAVDTTQATSTNRVKMYLNGSQITSFSSSSYPAQNYSNIMNSAVPHVFGKNADLSNEYFNGLMASTYFIDGQALTPSSFGETDATTGIWKPKSYSGTYGTNGFYLKFENSEIGRAHV